MKKLLIITNSRAVTKEVHESLVDIKLGNGTVGIVHAAHENELSDVYVGINRKYPEKLDSDADVHLVQADIYCNIFDFKQILKSYRHLYKIITNEQIDTIHCNTPIGGVIGRLLGKFHHNVQTVFYTVHGFHFYKGAPASHHLIYKTIERFLARHTDCLLTMNQEDFESAKTFRLKPGGTVHKISGVGVNLAACNKPLTKAKYQALRAEFGIKTSDLVFIYIGDLIPRKNITPAIEAVNAAKAQGAHLIICGSGVLERELKALAQDNVHFAGFRRDISDLLQASDCLIFPTFQEGLPRAVMEAMVAGLPCIVSNVRGNCDLIDFRGGFLVDPHDAAGFKQAVQTVLTLQASGKLQQLGSYNRQKVRQFSFDVVKKELSEIYAQRRQLGASYD